jgi:hypothetical protein
MRKGLRIFLASISLVLVLLTTGFVVWGETPAQPMTEALAALQSDAQVTITSGRWLAFTPVASEPTTGFIIYPGGRVDYRAYAPAAHQIAAQGYLVVIVQMPLNLAVFGVNAAQDVQAAYPHPGAVQGLALWAAYPASSNDLSRSGLRVVSIFGSQDGLATGEKIDASRPLLPANTTWVKISGGDHAQFGWYGDQAGDNPASISRSDQQAQIINATLSFLEGLK